MSPALFIAVSANLFSSVCATVIGLVAWRGSGRPLKLITLFLIYTQIIFIVQKLSVNVWGNNYYTIHAYTAVSYILIASAFAAWHKTPISNFMYWSILLYLGSHASLLLLGMEQINHADKYSGQLSAFLIAAITLYTIFTLADEQHDIPIHAQPLFWISMGLFLLFPGTIFVTAAITKYYSANLILVYSLSATIGYCLTSVGFLCLKWKN